MTDWGKVVAQPLGIAGFAMSLVFGYLARAASRDQRKWLAPSAAAIAFACVIGGFALAYQQTTAKSNQQPNPSQAFSQQQTKQVHQITNGSGSPAIQGVIGDVTVIDQSSGQSNGNTPAPPKSSKANK
jgi:hypothetical protein